ncbi:MAG TPA: SPOR domain-containing protein [Cellvibrionaceae bacterium]|nr:SPOR domain-containing protein [Cellvibrionaceae bacterium]HNG58871.1 SPOR domain-containing protein [Cellvibrionaceae bacterium]
MDDGLKQRIVGALVLLALLVIFLPVLFDRNRVEPVDPTSQIPPPVSVPAAPINAPQVANVAEADMAPPPAQMLVPAENLAEKPEQIAAQTAKLEAAKTAKNDAAKADSKNTLKLTKSESVKPVLEAPKLNNKGSAEAWLLQAASYKTAAQAKKLRDDLAAKGFNAYTRELTTPKGLVVRVFIGPKFDKATALEQKKRIDELFKLNVLLLPYTPSN